LDNDEVGMSPVLAPTKKDAPKEKDTPAEPTPAKAGNGKSTAAATSKSSKRKAPAVEDEKKPSSNKKAKADGDKVVTDYKPIFFIISGLVLSSLYLDSRMIVPEIYTEQRKLIMSDHVRPICLLQ
jgi:hypothetical protein